MSGQFCTIAMFSPNQQYVCPLLLETGWCLDEMMIAVWFILRCNIIIKTIKQQKKVATPSFLLKPPPFLPSPKPHRSNPSHPSHSSNSPPPPHFSILPSASPVPSAALSSPETTDDSSPLPSPGALGITRGPTDELALERNSVFDVRQ